MCFFSPNTDALTPLRSHETPDRAPDHLADGTPAALREDLIALLGPTAVRSRVTDLVKYATDASPYRLFPQVVIVAESVEQIAKTLDDRRIPFVFISGALNHHFPDELLDAPFIKKPFTEFQIKEAVLAADRRRE